MNATDILLTELEKTLAHRFALERKVIEAQKTEWEILKQLGINHEDLRNTFGDGWGHTRPRKLSETLAYFSSSAPKYYTLFHLIEEIRELLLLKGESESLKPKSFHSFDPTKRGHVLEDVQKSYYLTSYHGLQQPNTYYE